MADKTQSLDAFKEKFDDQLTCSVCLDQYTNPKTLPCLHSFCVKCIEIIPVKVKDGKQQIGCPTCRVDHLLPEGGPNSLPSAFQINALIDLRKTLKSTKMTVPSVTQTDSMCPEHNVLLNVYCETCDKVICRDCTISTEHSKHEYQLISECYPKHHQQIRGNLDHLAGQVSDMSVAMLYLDTTEREVLEQGESVKEQITAHAQHLIDNIQQSKALLIEQVDTTVQQKRKTLSTQKQQAQKMHTQLKTCQDMIEHSLKEWNQQQILTQKTIMIKEMKLATERANPAVFQPIEDANIQHNRTEKEMGSITRTAYDKATLEVLACIINQPSTATLTLYSQDGSPFSLPPSLISCTFTSPGKGSQSEKCPVTQTQPGKYDITFTPCTRNDTLIVQIGGVDVPDSPFALPVILEPEIRKEPVKIITGLNQPVGIAVFNNGDIVVADQGSHCVSILGKNGEKLITYGKRGASDGQLNSPCGVAISSDGDILVTDRSRLQKLTLYGMWIDSIGSNESGNGQLQFYNPRGIAVHPTTGQIFVADSLNNRIQVFTDEFIFSHTITPTLLPPQFSGPRDIAIDSNGYLYVADNGHPCIFKLSSSDGKFIKMFGQQIVYPISLSVHNNLVYVCDYRYNRVSVFDTDGRFYHHFRGRETMKNPQSISTDNSGRVYVSDTGNNRIIVY